MPTIGNAPLGEDTSLDGTEKVPVSGSKYILISTIRDYIWNYLTSLTAKTSLADDDQVSIADSAASNDAKKITWANVKAAIKTYADTLYLALVAPGTSGNVLTSNGSAWESAAPAVGATGLPAGHIYGLTLSNNSSDATNDIDIATGKCRNSTDAVDMSFASALTKRLDANWAAGTNQGMRNSAAAITDTTYHIYAVAKAASADPDFYAHTSTSVATVLAALQAETGGSAYIYARRIGSIIRASGAILAFTQNGDEFLLNTLVNNANGENSSSTAALKTLTVPIGIKVNALFTLRVDYVSAAEAVLVTSPDQADQTATTQIQTVTASSTASSQTSTLSVRTNTSGQVRIRASTSNGTDIYLTTIGWIDTRGRLAS